MSTLRWTLSLTLIAAAAAAVGCEEEKSNKIVLGQKAADCDLSFDSMVGKTYVLEKIKADKSTEPDPQTRFKLSKDGGSFVVKYNVSSLSDMYDYRCTERNGELVCYEDVGEKLPDFCKALIAGGAECSPEAMKELVPMATDEAISAAIEEATAAADKYRDKPEWEKFVFANNNLGNKLMGILYIAVDARKCQPRITDNYMTIYDGKKVEDSNPVGTNHFVETDKTLIFEHCSDSQNLVATAEAELPKDLSGVSTRLEWGSGDTVHYHYIDESKPAEGCTYSFDFWKKWEPDQQGVAAEVSGKSVSWHVATEYTEPGAYVTHMVRYKTCDGKKEELGVSCNLVQVR